MTNSYDRVLTLVSTLSFTDLKRLKRVVDELVTTGYLPAQGSIEYRFVTRSGKRYGPYKYRRLWQHGKLVDQYEGKATPEEYQGWLSQKTSLSIPSVDPSPVEDK
jgi:hypothetical protein